MKPSPLDTCWQAIDRLHIPAIDSLCELLRVQALGPENGGQGEWEKSQCLQTMFAPLVDNITAVNAPDARVTSGQRPNLIATIRGQGTGPRCWLVAHLDTVAPGPLDAWHTPPFEPTLRDGKLFARGAEDNHQAIGSLLLLARALQTEQLKPRGDLCFLFIADEETGSNFGIKYLLAHADPFRADDLVVVPDGGNAEGNVIDVAEKGILQMRVTVRGKGVHASTPHQGLNAHRLGAQVVCALEQLHTQFPRRDDHFEPPTATFEPTKTFSNDVSYNAIPGEHRFGIDSRMLPGMTAAETLRHVTALVQSVVQSAGGTATVEPVQSMEPAPATPDNAPVAQRVRTAVQQVLGIPAHFIGVGGITIASYLRAAGYPAVVYTKVDDTLHTPNEYCRIANLVSDAKVLAHVVLGE
ncbi:MAG: M20 family metallo-hydrolase [Deltaproteobacteria bacterium]|nr:M20 family metallo-hydrolase [Deltaproteobacteria bacterium]